MNERKSGILISYLNIVLHAIIGFAYVPILLHYIGKSEYGLYQLIGSFIAYFSIMDFGLTAAVVRFYAKYKALRDELNMENILAIALRAYVVITVFMLVAGVGIYLNLPYVFAQSMNASEIASAKQLFLLLLFNIVITISTMIFRAVINAHERFLFLKGLETIQLVLQPILVVLVLQKLPSALAVAGVQTALNLALIGARIFYCFKKLHITVRFHYWDREMFADFRKLALSIFAVAVIDQVFFKTNQVILGIVSGTTAVAVYSIASLIYMNYMSLSTAISGVYLPHITGLVAQNAPMSKLTGLFVRIGRLQYFLLALVVSGFVIFGKQFIIMWAGESFADAYVMTLLIIIPFTVDLIQNIGLSIMQAQNKYDFRAKVFLVTGIFNLLLAVPLTLKYGGIGCSFATGLSWLLSSGVVMNWYYAKVTGLDIARFWREIGRISIGVIGVTVFGYTINFMLQSVSTMIFVIKIIVYSIMYYFIMYKFFMNSNEREKVHKIISRSN